MPIGPLTVFVPSFACTPELELDTNSPAVELPTKDPLAVVQFKDSKVRRLCHI